VGDSAAAAPPWTTPPAGRRAGYPGTDLQ